MFGIFFLNRILLRHDVNDMKMTFFQVKSGRELEKQLRRFQEVEEIKTLFGEIKYQFWSIEPFVLKVKYD